MFQLLNIAVYPFLVRHLLWTITFKIIDDRY